MPGGDVADWTWRGVMSGATELSAALRQLSGMHDENRGLTRELKELALQMERERDKASSSAPSTSSERARVLMLVHNIFGASFAYSFGVPSARAQSLTGMRCDPGDNMMVWVVDAEQDVSEDIGRLQNENRKLKGVEQLSSWMGVWRGSVVSPTSSEVAEEQWDAVPGLIHDTLQKELVICTKSLSERDRLLQEKDLALELCLRKCDTLDHARESAERKLRREISTLQKEAGTLRTNLHEREEAIKEEKKELKRDIFTLKNQLVQAANRSA
eukprot:gene4729-5783_t